MPAIFPEEKRRLARAYWKNLEWLGAAERDMKDTAKRLRAAEKTAKVLTQQLLAETAIRNALQRSVDQLRGAADANGMSRKDLEFCRDNYKTYEV